MIEDLLYNLSPVYENISVAESVDLLCHNNEHNFDLAQLIISNGM
jgi:hypothetical protein